MKKIFLILSVLFSAVCFGQSKTYIRGDSIFLINNANSPAHTVIRGTLQLNDGTQVNGYVLTTDANGNATWQPASGGGGGTPGSPNTSIQRNLNGSFSGTDSLVVDVNGVQSKYNVIIGNNVGTSLANLTVRGNGGNAISNQGPPNVNFSNQFWYNNYAIDSNVLSVSAFHPVVNGVPKSIGHVNYREIDIAGTGLGLQFRFTVGGYNQLRINLTDSLYQNALNLDQAFSQGSILSYYKHAGYSGKSVLFTSNLLDGPSAHLAQIDFQGSSGGNYFYVNGHLFGHTSYLLSSANGLDTVKRYSAFTSGYAGSLTPYVEEIKEMEIGGLGGMPASHVGKAYGLYVYNRTGGLTLNYLAGPTGFGSGNIDPTANVDILGTLKYVDGNQSAGRVLTSDVDGNATWQDASGGTDSPDRINGTATGNVNADMGSNQINFTTTTYPGGNIYLQGSGRLYLGDVDGDGNNNRIDINDPSDNITINLGTTGTFVYAADYSANYTNRSLVDKEYVDDAVAAGGGGSIRDTLGTAPSNGTRLIVNDAGGYFLFTTTANGGTPRIRSSTGAYLFYTPGLGSEIDIYNSGASDGLVLSGQSNNIGTAGGGNIRMDRTTSFLGGIKMSSTTSTFQLSPLTATQASALTPAQGDIICVSSTNGTFTAVGFWGYNGSAWTQL